MIELIQNLAKCDEKFFSGWILARVQIILNQNAVVFSNKLISATRRKAIFKVKGVDEKNIVQQSLKVLLLLPKTNIVQSAKKTTKIGLLFNKQKFDIMKINEYVALSGDKNIIHKGEKPIVPGLLMILYLHKFFKTQMYWNVKFICPVYADDEVCFYQKDTIVNAYVNERLVFTINFNKVGGLKDE